MSGLKGCLRNLNSGESIGRAHTRVLSLRKSAVELFDLSRIGAFAHWTGGESNVGSLRSTGLEYQILDWRSAIGVELDQALVSRYFETGAKGGWRVRPGSRNVGQCARMM